MMPEVIIPVVPLVNFSLYPPNHPYFFTAFICTVYQPLKIYMIYVTIPLPSEIRAIATGIKKPKLLIGSSLKLLTDSFVLYIRLSTIIINSFFICITRCYFKVIVAPLLKNPAPASVMINTNCPLLVSPTYIRAPFRKCKIPVS